MHMTVTLTAFVLRTVLSYRFCSKWHLDHIFNWLTIFILNNFWMYDVAPCFKHFLFDPVGKWFIKSLNFNFNWHQLMFENSYKVCSLCTLRSNILMHLNWRIWLLCYKHFFQTKIFPSTVIQLGSATCLT